MGKRSFLLLLLAFGLLISLVAPLAAYSFFDDFEDPAAFQATWVAGMEPIGLVPDTAGVGSMLEVTGRGFTVGSAIPRWGRSFLVDETFTITTDIYCPRGGDGGIAFAYQGVAKQPGQPDSMSSFMDYNVGINPGTGIVGLDEDVLPPPVIHYHLARVTPTMGTHGFVVTHDTWYRLQVKCTATNFEVWMAPRGQVLVKLIDVSQDAAGPHLYDTGGVAAWAGEKSRDPAVPLNRVYFDNFSVEGTLDPEPAVWCPGVAIHDDHPVVPVYLDEGEGVRGVQLDLTYRSDLVSSPVVTAGSLAPTWTVGYQVIQQDPVTHLDTVRVIAFDNSADPQPLPAGGGEIAHITFTPAGAAPDSVGLLDLSNVILANSSGVAIPCHVWDGFIYQAQPVIAFALDPVATPQFGHPSWALPFAITIHALDSQGDPATGYNGPVTLSDLTGTVQLVAPLTWENGTGTGTVTIGTRHPADVIRVQDGSLRADTNPFQMVGLGDVDGDDNVDVADVVCVLAAALQQSTLTGVPRLAADANHDGSLDVLDVILVQNMALGRTPLLAPRLGAATASRGMVLGGKAAPPAAGQVVVPVQIGNPAGVAGCSFQLRYDPKALTPVGIRAGGVLAGRSDWSLNANFSRNPVPVVCYSTPSRGLAAGKGGTLVELLFAQVGKGKGSLTISQVVLSDTEGKRLPGTLSLGKSYTTR